MMRTPRFALVLLGALSLASCFGGKKVPPTLLTLVTAQFLHGSVLHIFFNMLFLLVFGPEIGTGPGSGFGLGERPTRSGLRRRPGWRDQPGGGATPSL